MATVAGGDGYAGPTSHPKEKIMTSLFFILRITLATMLTYIIAMAILVENFLRYIFGNTEGSFVASSGRCWPAPSSRMRFRTCGACA